MGIAIGNHLRTNLIEDGGVILAVENLDFHRCILFIGQGKELAFRSGADFIQRGVIKLLHNGNLEAGLLSKNGNGTGGNGHGSGKNQTNQLFHHKISFLTFSLLWMGKGSWSFAIVCQVFS